MKPTISFRKNADEHEQQQVYKRQISHFSHHDDRTFKRFFSGFGTEGKAHHGSGESKFKQTDT
jgi:ribosomal protein L44E